MVISVIYKFVSLKYDSQTNLERTDALNSEKVIPSIIYGRQTQSNKTFRHLETKKRDKLNTAVDMTSIVYWEV